jgi:sulfide:quinone oxidoreductase
LIGVPPHRPPKVVAESALGGEGGWIKVDPGTLATGHDGVYAVGDCTAIKLANGLPMPKAGIIAELEGARVAAAIAADLRGDPDPPPFDGRGYCFVEMGRAKASLVEGEFFAEPEPNVSLREPSAANAEEKHRFEAERLERWFGS